MKAFSSWCLLAAVASAPAWAGGKKDESLAPYRAVTLTVGERRIFEVPGLDTITGSSGACLEEGLEVQEQLYINAACAGVRTSIFWLRDGSRLHVLACAEEEDAPKEGVALRKAMAAALKGMPSVTACVRAKRVELLGWTLDDAQQQRVKELAQKNKTRVDDKTERIKDEPKGQGFD